MNIKYLIETLSEIPDRQFLQELGQQISDKPIILANLVPLYKMFHSLFSCSNIPIKLSAINLFQKLLQSKQQMLPNDIQQAWNIVSVSLIRMIGEQDSQIRKKSSVLLFIVIDQTSNANIVLQKLYYEGMQNQSTLVQIQSIKQSFKILQTYTSILQNKTGINIMKNILQKMINYSQSNIHIQLQKSANQFLNRLFYLKIDRLDDVLILMNQYLLQQLEKIWAKQKQKLLIKQSEGQQKQNKQQIVSEIKYEHLPLINGKFFNVYQPYVLKNIFNPDLYTAKNLAIKHFRQGYQNHQQQLHKYINVVYKILIKFLHQEHYDLLFMLKKIVMMNGITNIVNLAVLPKILISQLETQNVLYRRDLKQMMKKLNYIFPGRVLLAYKQQINANQMTMNWIKMNQILILLQHWVDSNLQAAYPPALDPFLKTICRNLNNSKIKLQQKSLQLLLTLLDRYPGYRQNLQQIFTQEQIGQIQDKIQQRKTKGKSSNKLTKQAQQIFKKDYQQERQRYMKFKK